MNELSFSNQSNLPAKIVNELVGGMSENTSRAYISDIRGFFQVDSLDELSMDRITSVTIGEANAFLESMYNDGLANATINRKMQAMSKFYKILCRRDIRLMEYNPFSRDEGANRLKNRNYSNTRVLTDVEVQKFIDEVLSLKGIQGVRDKIIVMLLISNGLRRAEIASIKIGQISKSQGKRVIEVMAKGRKDKLFVISEQLYNLISYYISLRGLSFLDKEAPLLVSHSSNANPDKHISAETIYQLVKKLAKASGIHEDSVSPHSFRHTYASKLLDIGYSINNVQDLLGHSDISTTRRYTHAKDILENSPVEKIQEIYSFFDTNPDYKQY